MVRACMHNAARRLQVNAVRYAAGISDESSDRQSSPRNERGCAFMFGTFMSGYRTVHL